MQNSTLAMPLIEDLSSYGIEDCSYSPEAQKINAYSTPEESFFHLLLCVMGKTVDLSDYDRVQILMARRLGTSIAETARLGFSRSTVVSTYAKWMNDGETSSR
ncbi:hypothetical protein TNCV_1596171 [Trichonephila clavipes]|nr:hypothetical protein TNCV_1596171 [Trichonephila clavipes]